MFTKTPRHKSSSNRSSSDYLDRKNNPIQKKDLKKTQRPDSSWQVGNQNQSNLPTSIKTRMEGLSGYSLDDVRVHYNSGQPSKMNALAFAKGSEIFLGPGQEKHLPHEAWHVVQQKQGRVRPTGKLSNLEVVNNDLSLENEADAMASRVNVSSFINNKNRFQHRSPQSGSSVIQAMLPNKSTDSSMATYLTASLEDGTLLCDNLSNSAAGHSEDRFIDEVLPAKVASLDATSVNVIYISLNRSPCTSTDHLLNGSPSCGKGAGKPGCAERLINLVKTGFKHAGTTYNIKIFLDFRNLYGDTTAKRANSAEALHVMNATGKIECDTQQRGGPTGKFMGTSAAMEYK